MKRSLSAVILLAMTSGCGSPAEPAQGAVAATPPAPHPTPTATEAPATSASAGEPAAQSSASSAPSGLRPLRPSEEADRCGYKGNLICCLGPEGITPPPKPLCYPADR
ncbi:MAG: hypothetical protein JNL21_19145 [Myxococcales bacterium]|nr:hypothetical protein [Myxococcales bacterium]